jgi:hypothetical protein
VVYDDAWWDPNEPVNASPHPVFLESPAFGWVLRLASLVWTLIGVGGGSINHGDEPIDTPIDAVHSLARRVAFDAC